MEPIINFEYPVCNKFYIITSCVYGLARFLILATEYEALGLVKAQRGDVHLKPVVMIHLAFSILSSDESE